MKTVSVELKALLDGGRYKQAELHTLTMANGEITRIGTLPGMVLNWGGHDFSPNGLMFERGAITSKLHRGDLDVDNADMTLWYKPGDLLAGIPVPQFVRNGGLNGARLLIQKAFCSIDNAGNTNPDVVGVIFLFEGRVSKPKPGVRSSCTFTLVSDAEKLSVNVPKETINLNCMNTHYDGRCGLSEAAYTHSATVTSASKTVLNTALSQASGYFSQGRVVFTSGDNTGVMRTVKRYASGQFVLASPLPYMPQAGDEFDAVAGCDLSAATCGGRFENLANRRCFPFVPPYEENL